MAIKQVPKPDPQLEESQAYAKQQEAELRKQWLSHPLTKQLIDDTEATLNKTFDVAIECAYTGKEDAAIRNLIQARAFKEMINYARGNDTE